MTNPTKQAIIDVAPGNITQEYSDDGAILIGEFPVKGSSYFDKLELVLNKENSNEITTPIEYTGYNLNLFTGDFTGNKRSEILIRGDYGGSGRHVIGSIYSYDDDKLKEIYNLDQFSNDNICTGKYEDNYKITIKCGKKKYKMDISKKTKEYLDKIYNSQGKVKIDPTISIDYPISIYPIKQNDKKTYELIIQQRVLGLNNQDLLGVIQTQVNLENKKPTNVYKALLNFGRSEIKRILEPNLT